MLCISGGARGIDEPDRFQLSGENERRLSSANRRDDVEVGAGRPPRACIELLKHVPLEKALATELKRPGPLEFDFPNPDVSAKYGPELFPTAASRKTRVPGNLAAANKKPAERSIRRWATTAKASFKLNNPPETTGTDVATCVWGWFGAPPSMILSAGKTYEFSARLKCSGTTPQLRIALPQARCTKPSANQCPTPAAGSACTIASRPAPECKPKYFAVWLQGPGTVWCDDLSFRESGAAAISLSVSESLVDDRDHGFSIYIKQNGGNAPLKSSRDTAGRENGTARNNRAAQGNAGNHFSMRRLCARKTSHSRREPLTARRAARYN